MKRLKHLLFLFVLLAAGGAASLIAQVTPSQAGTNRSTNLNIQTNGASTANQTICNGEAFTNITLSCYRSGYQNYNNAGVYVRYVNGSGTDILGIGNSWTLVGTGFGYNTNLPNSSTSALTRTYAVPSTVTSGSGRYEFALTGYRSGGGGGNRNFISQNNVTVTLTRKAALSHSGLTASTSVSGTVGDNLTVSTFPGVGTGNHVVWVKDAGDAGKNIGLAANGTGNIPAFTAENATNAPITVTYWLYVSDGTCNSIANTTNPNSSGKKVAFTVNPFTIPTTVDPALTIPAFQDQTALQGGAFTAVSLDAAYSGTGFTGQLVKYAIEFDGGTDILNLGSTVINGTGGTSSSWNLASYSTTIVGEGTYKVTPIFSSKAGVAKTIKLKVDYPLDNSKILLPGGGNLTVLNGDQIADYTLLPATGLPAGTEVHWKYVSQTRANNTGLGVNTFNGFTALNNGASAITLNYQAWLVNGSSTTTPVAFTITVNPHVVADLDLAAVAVEDQKACYNTAFNPITLNATHINAGFTGNVTYTVEFAGGTNVLGTTVPYTVTSTGTQTFVTWTPAASTTSGTGTYRITPTWNGNAGNAVLLNVTVAPELDITSVAIPSFTYTVGDNAPLYLITGATIPAGASVVWEEAGSSAISIDELATGGVNVIPAFAAKAAGVATYNYYLKYDNCESAKQTFTITINDAVPTYDLTVAAVEDQTVCYNTTGVFAPMTLTPNSTDPSIILANVSYRWDFYSGTNVLNAMSGTIAAGTPTWTPVKVASASTSGKEGVYSITPIYNGVDGTPVYVTLKVGHDLDALLLTWGTTMWNGNNTLTYYNGDMVPELTLNSGNLPEGISVAWLRFGGDNLGMVNTMGMNVVPAFRAVNETNADLTATYHVYLKDAINGCNGNSTASPVQFTIIVKPKTIGDPNLSITPVAKLTACSGYTFSDITLTAESNDPTLATATAGDVTFEWKYVSGDHVLGINDTQGTIATTAPGASAIWSLSTLSGNNYEAGTGLYTVTPKWKNGEGLPLNIELKRYEGLLAELNGQTMTVSNGQVVDEIAFNFDRAGSADALIKWSYRYSTYPSGNPAGFHQVGIGTLDNGARSMPQFVAVNEGDQPIKATFQLETFYGNEPNSVCPSLEQYFHIIVLPSTIGDKDLVTKPVSGTTVCYEDVANMPSLVFDTERTDGQPFAGDVTYRVEFVSGAEVLDLVSNNSIVEAAGTAASWIPTASNVSGTGTYKVTPRWNNNEGVSSVFTIEVGPNLDAILADIIILNKAFGTGLEYNNGDQVAEYTFEGIPSNVELIWEKDQNTPDVGTLLAGMNRIPAFTATNATNAPIVSEYVALLKYNDCFSTTPQKFIITVNPKTVGDLDLVAKPVAGTKVCYNDAATMPAITFDSERTDAQAFTGDVTYTVEFVSGAEVLDLVSNNSIVEAAGTPASWTATASNVSGTGTYRVTPRWNNNEGKSSVFTVTVGQNLDAVVTAFDAIFQSFNAAVYSNGDQVPELKLTGAGIPEGVSIYFERASASYDKIENAPLVGYDVMPSFMAVNTTDQPLVGQYNFMVVDNSGCSSAIKHLTYKLTINPKTIGDLDLVTKPVAGAKICHEDLANISAIVFEAERTDAQAFTGDVTYSVEFVSGAEVLDLVANNSIVEVAGTAASWTPTTSGNSGVGTYRVTPRWNNNEGKSSIFTVSVGSDLNTLLRELGTVIFPNNADGNTFVYSNGDFVPEMTLGTPNLPQGIIASWMAVNIGTGIGINDAGQGTIPAFVAKNETSSPIKVDINLYLEDLISGCSSDISTPIEFTIIVNPRTVDDFDLSVTPVESQTICESDDFADITLVANHRFPSVNDLTTGSLAFEWELVAGTNILDPIAIKGDISPATGNTQVVWDLSTATAKVVGTGTYRVTPIWNNNRGVATIFTLTRLPEANVNKVNPIVLCNGEGLNFDFTSDYPSTVFEWELVDNATQTTPVTSQIGLPDNGTVGIHVSKLVNTTNTAITETVKVTPRFPIIAGAQVAPCPGTPMIFTITVLPTPTVNPINSIVVGNGDVISNTDIEFIGTATEFKWSSSNPAINANNTAPSSGIVAPDGNGKFFMPGFTAQNATQDPIISEITVTPVYKEGNHSCEGEPTKFYIVVASKPAIANIPNQVECEGGITAPITPQGLPSGNGYFIRWTGGSTIGLDDSGLVLRTKSIPSFTAKIGSDLNNPTVATIVVTPVLAIGTQEFLGTPVQFTYSVTPKTRMVAGYEESVIKHESYCQGDAISLKVEATGYNLKYQWYKDHVLIAGATTDTYAVNAADVDIKDTGKYYAVVTGDCGTVKSMTYDVLVKVNVVSQRWNDALVLNCNPAQNGGFEFVSYQWYTISGSIATKITGENKSYLYVAGGLSTTTEYFVEAVTNNGIVYQSCPVFGKAEEVVKISIYPNPVKTGEPVTVEASLPDSDLNQMKIQVLSMNRVISTTKATGRTTMITMPNTPGVYVINVLIGNDSKSFKVIVK